MLELKNICKSYKTGDYYQKALHNINLKFRENEFVAILGPSGSGKTTLLNIIGGLDRYDTGDLIINDVSTKEFKDSTWDAYRNNSVGMIDQSYNLISHISILENLIYQIMKLITAKMEQTFLWEKLAGFASWQQITIYTKDSKRKPMNLYTIVMD